MSPPQEPHYAASATIERTPQARPQHPKQSRNELVKIRGTVHSQAFASP